MKHLLDLAPLFLTAWLTAAAQGPGTGVNFNHSTPAAPSGARNVTFQNDSSRPTVNMSAYVTFPTVQIACPSGSDLSTAVNACLASLPTPTGGKLARQALTTVERSDPDGQAICTVGNVT